MDSSDLGAEAVLSAIAGVGGVVLLASFVVAVAAGSRGGRRLGLSSIGLALVVVVAAAVDMVVIWRTVDGEVSGWDLLWAAVLTVGGVWSLRRLASSRPPSGEAT